MSRDRSDCFHVKQNGHGEMATFSKSAFAAGQLVYLVQGAPSPKRTRETIQVAPDQHVEDPCALFINHSFTSNLDVRGRELVALTHIAEGDELTFNYLASESGIAAPFVCHDTGQPVNSQGCRSKGQP